MIRVPERPVKVLALVTDAYGSRGGIARYNRDLLGALGLAGNAGVVVLPRIAPDAETTPSNVRQERAKGGRVSYSAQALNLARRERPDVVFCGHVYMAPLAALVARIVGARLIVQLHGIEAWTRPDALVRAAVERADAVFCVSRHTRAAALSWANIAPEKIIVIPNTVGADFAAGGTSDLRAELGLSECKVLLTVGRLHPAERYKGHDRVIAALPAVAARGHDVVYVIVGEGEDQSRLAALAADAGVADRVIFLGGVDHERLRRAYLMADLFVMPSTGEGFGIAFLEAMASGTPALGLADGGARDALGDGSLGGIATEANLADAISDALDRPVDRVRLASATQGRFGREKFAEGVDRAFRRVIAA